MVLTDTSLLHKALKRLGSVRPERDAVEVAGGEQLRLRCAGLEVEAEVRLPVPAEGFPGAVVSRKHLLDLLEGTEGPVELALDRGWFRVRSGRFSAELISYSPEVNPVGIRLLTEEAEPLFRVEAGAFLEALEEAAALARASAVMPEVLLEVEEGGVRLVATDGYRLYLFALEAQVQRPGVEYLLRPGEALAALRALDPGPSLTFSKPQKPQAQALVVEGLWGKAAFALGAGSALPYRQVIPQGEPLARLRVDATPLREALKRALVVAEGTHHGVELQGMGEEVRVSALDGELRPLSEELLPGEGEGALQVNGRYLLSALEVFGPGKAELQVHPHARGKLLVLEREGFHAYISLLQPAQNPAGAG